MTFAGSPLEHWKKIWEIWEFFRPKYGRNMGDLSILQHFFEKNMGNMGDLKKLIPYEHNFCIMGGCARWRDSICPKRRRTGLTFYQHFIN